MLRKILDKLGVVPSTEKETYRISGNNFLGEILIIRNKCTRKQVSEVLEVQRVEGAGRKIGNLLMTTYKISQDDITEALEIQTYLREDLCANKSMEKLENSANNFLLQKQILQESIQDMNVTLDRANGTLT